MKSVALEKTKASPKDQDKKAIARRRENWASLSVEGASHALAVQAVLRGVVH